ncbi:hypothetical protein [Nocardia sputorum]|uniref:ANTAR domain-containing protein n=1 Tax=Nocardia sputorum TaxID=2984338 RepID=A0ABN6U2C1_9NOCA|nr:hypothetical protein [Nocardia sputorum]BDT99293.1 hypothetical protein IFM12276_23220 [Nocardia sputorum]
MTDPRSRLHAALREPADVIAMLTTQESAQLLMMIQRAKQQQRRSLDAAIDAGLGVLPRVVRISAKTILFGK